MAGMVAIIALDIGGTHLRAATYLEKSNIPIKHQRTATQSNEGNVYDRIVDLITSVWPEDQVQAISVAIPGPIDPETGSIIETPNIKGWAYFPLGQKLNQRFRVPVFLGNDANLAALGEWYCGAGEGHHDLIYLTISTGIGGGVINADKLLLGCRGLAAELGHVTIMPGGPLCSCGQRGHLEAIASGPGIAHFVNEKLAEGRTSILHANNTLSSREIAEAAQAGDALALDAFAYAGEYLGLALANYLHIFNPSMVIFGGGVSQSGALILDPVKESMKRHVMDPSYLEGLELAFAKLGDDAGLLGALTYARLKLAE
jgi:glucokinase